MSTVTGGVASATTSSPIKLCQLEQRSSSITDVIQNQQQQQTMLFAAMAMRARPMTRA